MSSYHRVVAGLILCGAAVAGCADLSSAPEVPAGAPLAVSPFPAGLVTLEWQAQGRSLVEANLLNPLASSRVYAALSVAQYLAVQAADLQPTGEGTRPGSGFEAGGRSRFETHRGAIAGASAQVLAYLFPAATDQLNQLLTVEGGAGPGQPHPAFSRGVALGRAAGDRLINRLASDGFTVPWTGTVPVGPGLWIANGTPAGGTFAAVTPYFLTSPSQFRPGPPPAFNSPAYNIDLTEVLTIAQNRTAEQTAIALFWNYPAGTPTPPGFWNEKAESYVTQANLDERAAAHVFALMHAAMFDAQIGCWDAKYYYWMIRPSQANPLITLTFPLPNHPSYPSGHSCVSSSAGGVLSHFFPDRAGELAELVALAGLSRIFAGIHYRFDITAGQALGQAVAEWAISRQGTLQ